MRKASHDRYWNHFVRWCHLRRLRPLPAHPWTLAAYARSRERRDSLPKIEQRLQDIARVHVLRCHPLPHRHPTVERTLHCIRLRQQSRGNRAALFRNEDFVQLDEQGVGERTPGIRHADKRARSQGRLEKLFPHHQGFSP